jgi:hypothetical protein
MRFENRFRNIFFSINLIMTFEQTTGSRAQVWHGTAKKTSGGLTKTALMMNKHGRIVSRKKHNTAKKDKRLVKAGFLTKKGHFGFIKKGSRKNKSKKMRGGAEEREINEAEIIEDEIIATPGAMDEIDIDSRVSQMGMDGGRRRRRRTRRMRGGMAYGGNLSPLTYDGRGVGTSGVNLQFVAGSSA